MYIIKKSLVVIVFIASLMLPAYAFSDDYKYRMIPVYNLRDLNQTAPKLQLKVKEKVYPADAIYTIPEMLERAKNPYVSPENNVLGYIGYVLSDKFNEVEQLYPKNKRTTWGGGTPKGIAEFMRPGYKNTNKVKLMRSWQAGIHHKILVELLSPDGRVNTVAFSVEMRDGKYYQTGGWGSLAGPLLSIVVVNYRKDVGYRYTPVELPYSLTYYDMENVHDTLVKKNPATLYFDGKAYGLEDGWAPVGDVDRILEFVHKAMDIAANGTKEEVFSLFIGRERAYMDMVINKKDDYLSFIRDNIGSWGSDVVRHVFTLDLGKEYVHFYQLKGYDYKRDGKLRLRYLMIHDNDGKLSLGLEGSFDPSNRGKRSRIPSEIIELIKDEGFQEKIMELWRAKNAPAIGINKGN